MTRSRAIGVVGATVLALSVITGCGSGGFESAEGSDPTSGATGTVRMLVNITPNLTQSYWRGLVAPFEKANPGIKVAIDTPTSSDGAVDTTLPQLLAAGNPPDVVEGSHSAKVIPYLRDLSELPWAAAAPMADAQRLDGHLYDVAIGQQAQSLIFYNKTAFAKAGISTPPKSMRELTADMAKLKTAGYLPMQTAGEWVTQAQVMMLFDATLTADDPNWFLQAADGKRKLSKDLGPSLALYKSWLDKGYLDKNALGTKYPEAESDFLAGKSAMYPMGCWFVAAEHQAKKNFDVGVFAAPQLTSPSTPRLAVTPGANYRIFKAGKHQSAAAKLVQFLTTDHTAVESQLRQDTSFRTGYPYRLSPLADQVQGLLDSSKDSQAIVGGGEYQMPAGFEDEENKEIQSLYTGADPGSALKNVDNWLKAQPK
ncbi:ABC transporter substrate-binding protein [Streptomyces sp. AK02-01A]|uniref:ABC transporter substrate-binding protein n=1 Tax=Streptomyces sp. AK02-01A TaxID=3028648 RepID=UPI0029BF0C25|nr:extracellular solute-binding protein [Streptomyces sp. AK02-01A]MDX3853191.1 extracellular solute-binding protein [Streptomyces sp. AK02-01A]